MTANPARLLLLLAAALAACTPQAGVATAPTATLAPAASEASVPSPPALRVSVTETLYGSLALLTQEGAECSADVRVSAGSRGEAPPRTLAAQTAPATGVLRWTYSAPRVPQGRGTYEVVCRKGSASETASGTFDTYRPPIAATAMTVRVTTELPRDETFTADPSLVPLREAALVKMKATLADEWKSATRGLGGVEIVDRSADIAVHVLAARGTSVNRRGRDGSDDIVVYVSGEFGPKSVENIVATALHELGHIWCCNGPDADDGGHWKTKERDPGLYGVDKYGLMTDPVTCFTFGAIVSCPNRFSDREMRAIGFTSFPPPAPDPCVTQGLSLSAQLAPIENQVPGLKAQIDGGNARLQQLAAQLTALKAQYPNGFPPGPYATYEQLRAQYNTLIGQVNTQVAQYNSLLDRARAIGQRISALPCDWS